MPDFALEDEIGGRACGLDEVGRGPLAGPVVAACVYIPPDVRALPFISEIKDSKKLAPAKLEKLHGLITAHCVWAVAEISPQMIDEINILQASLLAMRRAMEEAGEAFDHALVDGNRLPQLPCPATAVVKGDSKSASIAAASIVAKFTRDRMMWALHKEYPHYGWDGNVGYPTKAHIEGISLHGITEHHRKSFGPVRDYLLTQEARNSAVFESKIAS
jgi:ribonuclease HII